jgi:hypothetical protein
MSVPPANGTKGQSPSALPTHRPLAMLVPTLCLWADLTVCSERHLKERKI